MDILRIGLVVVAVLSSGCIKRIEPSPPQSEPAPSIPPVEQSSVMIPVSVELESVRSAIDSNIPPGWAEWDAWIRGDHWCAKYKVERGGVALSMSGSHVDLNVPGHFWMQGCISPNNHACVPCGSCDANISVPVSTDVLLKPDWRFEAQLRNQGVRVDDCRVTAANININGRIADATNPKVDSALSVANSRLAPMLNFKDRGEAIWARATQPIRLSEGAWLMLNPQKVLATPPMGGGSAIRSAVGLVAKPQVWASAQPPAVPMLPFPNLEISAPSDAFHIALEGAVEYDAATQKLSEALAGRRYPFNVAGQTLWLEITNARVYGTGALAVLELGIKGDLNGRLYLTGKPQYDAVTDTLSVAHLDYSIETKNVLVQVAEWLLHEHFEDIIAGQAHWSLGKPIGAVRAKVQAALNATYGNVTLSGTLSSLRVLGIVADTKGFSVRTSADGHVSAALH